MQTGVEILKNGFGDIFQNTYTSDNSRIGHVYQYTKIGPTEYLYLKNNDTIAIPSKNGENNKFIRGAEAHCLRRAIKYFCQSHNDGNDVNIYESNANNIKSELKKITVYQYPNSKDKNKLISVTLWDYFQDMDLNLIFPYIFQLYKRNWDTWNCYELSQEKLTPEYLNNSYEYNLCFPLIQRWNNYDCELDPAQQTVYDAINKRIPSLKINNQINNCLPPTFNFKQNQIKNVPKNTIQNKIIDNSIQNNLSAKTQNKTNQTANVSNVVGNIKNKNESKDFNKNANENNKNEVVTENKIQTNKIHEKENSVNKIDANTNDENNLSIDKSKDKKLDSPKKEIQQSNKNDDKKVNIEIQNEANSVIVNVNTDDQNKIVEDNKSVDKKVIQEEANEEKNDRNNSEINIETNDAYSINNGKIAGMGNNKSNIQKGINSNEQQNEQQEQQNEQQIEGNKINTSNSTLEKNKKIAKTLIIIGVILFIAAIIVLLCKIYLAAIITSVFGFVFAGIGTIWIIKINCMRDSYELETLNNSCKYSKKRQLYKTDQWFMKNLLSSLYMKNKSKTDRDNQVDYNE